MKITHKIVKPVPPEIRYVQSEIRYVHLPNDLFASNLRGDDVKLLGWLISQKDGWEVTQDFIADGIGMSRSFVNEAIPRLCSIGVCVVKNHTISFDLSKLTICRQKLHVAENDTNNTLKQEEIQKEKKQQDSDVSSKTTDWISAYFNGSALDLLLGLHSIVTVRYKIVIPIENFEVLMLHVISMNWFKVYNDYLKTNYQLNYHFVSDAETIMNLPKEYFIKEIDLIEKNESLQNMIVKLTKTLFPQQ